MPRSLPLVLALAVTIAAAEAACAAPDAPDPAAPKGSVSRPAPRATSRHPVRHWHGYGFLPGYRTPEQVAREDAWLYWRRHPTYYWYGGPGFYRGRWNGGGFGPCWTQTPIGPIWNCGK